MNYLALIPTIVEIIKTVEQLMPEGGRGKEKLAAVRAMVEGVYGDITGAWPQIETVIGLFVRLANLSGKFKKG